MTTLARLHVENQHFKILFFVSGAVITPNVSLKESSDAADLQTSLNLIHAAVNAKFRSGDETAFFGREEQSGCSHFRGTTKAA